MNQIHVRPMSLAAFTAIAIALCGVARGDAGLSSWLASAGDGGAVVEEAPAPQVDGSTGAGAAEAP
jgi:hypothetical protein